MTKRKPRRISAEVVSKKATKKKAPKRAPKAELVSTKSVMITTTMAAIRRQAETDYITDPENETLAYHYNRDDRSYTKHVSLSTFQSWSKLGNWHDRRIQFWDEMQDRMLAHIRDRLFQDRMQRLVDNKELATYYREYLEPLRNAKGEVRRHPDDHADFPGLPIFPLKLPSLEKFIKSFLELQADIRLDSGEAVTRTETVGGKRKITVTALDPVSSLMDLSPEEARTMAQNLMRKRYKEMVAAGEELEMGVDDDRLDQGL